ncbi:NUDIX hydrolase [Leuconostoc rapi]|uniref:NUDIX hydrolase n=1 Tax=Leuconostoc rapi TaxID=1406906 RepID=UPI0019574DC1|nr:NUDIX domain-containing protein [Leuconostoc rapi]MBM7435901.1 isopentenyldiphosphate isomerase [Leuconostoc rapi]
MYKKDERADKLGEIWDIYDANRHLTGRKHLRGRKLGNGDYHLVVNALIFNVDGQILMQQRSFNKMSYPGVWTSATGGSALTGESSRQALMRELSEELNLLVTSDRLQFVNSIKYPDWIEDWFTVCIDASLTNLVYQSSEIEAVRWTSLEEAIKINNYNDVNDSTLLTRAQALLF